MELMGVVMGARMAGNARRLTATRTGPYGMAIGSPGKPMESEQTLFCVFGGATKSPLRMYKSRTAGPTRPKSTAAVFCRPSAADANVCWVPLGSTRTTSRNF